MVEPGEGVWKDWWKVVRPNARIKEFLRRSVPQQYRVYDSGWWYVHSKFVDAVRQIGAEPAEDDPYSVLYLRPNAPQAIIKAVWRELAKSLHPDCGGDVEAFKRAKTAYEKIVKD